MCVNHRSYTRPLLMLVRPRVHQWLCCIRIPPLLWNVLGMHLFPTGLFLVVTPHRPPTGSALLLIETSGASSLALSDQKLRRGAGVQLKLKPCSCHHQHQQKPHCHRHGLLNPSLHLQCHQGSVNHRHDLSRRFEHDMYAGAKLRVCTTDIENNGTALL